MNHTVQALNTYSGAVHITCRVAHGRDVFVRALYAGKAASVWEHYRRDRSGLEMYTGLVSEPAQLVGLESLASNARALGFPDLDAADSAQVRQTAWHAKKIATLKH